MLIPRPPGFTVAEVLISITVFSLSLGMLFLAFASGTSIYQEVMLRQGLQTEIRRIANRLDKDLSVSDFNTVGHLERQDATTTYRRDALSFAALSDWSDPAKRGAVVPRPLWDRHIVYYGTSEERGRLVRQVIEPGSPPPEGFLDPYEGLSDNLSDLHQNNDDLFQSSVLSNNLDYFEAEARLQDTSVAIRARLRKRGRKSGTEGYADEVLELTLLLRPKNTF